MNIMNLNYKQSQFELFPGASAGLHKTMRPQLFLSQLTLSLENAIIAGIFILMGVVFSFSVGVERGKKIALANSIKNVYSNVLSAPPEKAAPAPVAKQSTLKTMTPAPVAVPIPQENITNEVAPALVSAGTGSYTIQVASFKQLEYAQKEAEALRKKGYEIFVLPKGSYSIVCVGKFLGKDDADMTLARLKKTYKDLMLRRL